MTDADLAAAALAELKQTVRGLSGYSPPPRSHWGKALSFLGQVTIDTKSRDLAVSELRMTTVGYDYFVKKGVTPGPGSHWGKALACIAEIGATLKVTVSAPTGTLSGAVTVSADVTPAQQASTVTRVEFYVDGGLPKATDTTVPYSFSWDTTTVIDGPHQLKARAFYPTNKYTDGLLSVNTYNTAIGPTGPPPQGVPVNDPAYPPTISGTATEGQTLTVSTGVWTNSPTSYSRQWLRCDAGGNTPVSIPGATAASYTLALADVGSTIRCAVIASNLTGPSQQVITAQTAVVVALAGGVPVNTAAPMLAGSAVQGYTLSTGNGSWTNVPTNYTYKWQRCAATVIGDANILATGDSGNANLLAAQSTTLAQQATIQSLSFYVETASGSLRLGIYNDAGGRPGTKQAETAEFASVVGWNTHNVITPVSLAAGTYWLAYLTNSNLLAFRKATDASSSNRYYSFAYGPMPTTFSASVLSDPSHWSFYASVTPSVSCADISLATTNTYLLTTADVGSTIRSVVTAINNSGSSAQALSAPTALVVGAPPPPPPPPPPPAGHAYPRTYQINRLVDMATLYKYDWVVGFNWQNVQGYHAANPTGIAMMYVRRDMPAYNKDQFFPPSSGGPDAWTCSNIGYGFQSLSNSLFPGVQEQYTVLNWPGGNDTATDGSAANVGYMRPWVRGSDDCLIEYCCDPEVTYVLDLSHAATLVGQLMTNAAKICKVYTNGWNGVWSDNAFTRGTNAWGDGLVSVATALRNNLPGKIVGGNGAWISYYRNNFPASDPNGFKKFNANLVEGFSNLWGTENQTNVDSFIQWNNTCLNSPDPWGGPRYNAYWDFAGGSGLPRMRWGLTLAMMASMYFQPSNTPTWYDEFWGGSLNQRGYLGQATGAAVKIGGGIWRRDFDYGIALHNSTGSTQTVSLGGTFHKLTGTQDPTVNNGASVSSVTIADHDGLILLR